MKIPFPHNRLALAAITLALLFPAGAQAFDLSPDASRVLSDPAYLPLEKQLSESFEYIYGTDIYSTNDYQSNLYSSNNNAINTVNETVEYGITDDLTFRFSQSFEWVNLTDNPVNGPSTVTNSYGFTDPALVLIWRAVDQKKNFLNWDILGQYTPNFYAAQATTADEDGTVARGGDAAALGSALSYKTKSLTLYVEGIATYLDNRSVLNPINNIVTNTNSSFQYSLSASTQLRFSRQLSLNLTETHYFNTPASSSYTTLTNVLVSSNSVPGDEDNLAAALNFHVVPNQFVLSFIYNHEIYGNSSYNNLTFPIGSSTLINKTEDFFTGQVRCVFN